MAKQVAMVSFKVSNYVVIRVASNVTVFNHHAQETLKCAKSL